MRFCLVWILSFLRGGLLDKYKTLCLIIHRTIGGLVIVKQIQPLKLRAHLGVEVCCEGWVDRIILTVDFFNRMTQWLRSRDQGWYIQNVCNFLYVWHELPERYPLWKTHIGVSLFSWNLNSMVQISFTSGWWPRVRLTLGGSDHISDIHGTKWLMVSANPVKSAWFWNREFTKTIHISTKYIYIYC